MAESPGTWVKLGDLKWQYIPHEVKEKARELDLTWEGAASLAKAFRTERPSDEALKELGAHVNYVSLKPRQSAMRFAHGSSIDIVEFTPRNATTAKVRTAIQLIPATDVKPPPGNFNDTTKPPPGNFDDGTKPPGNFDDPFINHGEALVIVRSTPTNHGAEEEEQTVKSAWREHLVVDVRHQGVPQH